MSRPYSTISTPVVPKGVGALRGGFLGFFIGVSVTGAFVYKYVLNEYNSTNNVVLKDVLSLSKSIKVLEEHVKELENQTTKN